MPQIYGEREAAFLRLQRAIIQQSKDETIFAWPMSDEDGDDTYTGLLAQSPSNFATCNDVISVRGSTGFSESNGELSIKLRTFPYSMETYGALLNRTRQALPEARMSIFLARLSTAVKKAESGGQVMATTSETSCLTERLLRVALAPSEAPLKRTYGFKLRTIEPPGHADYQPRVLPKSETKVDNMVCLADGDHGTAGVVYMEGPEDTHDWQTSAGWSNIRWLKFGFDDEFNPTILLANGRMQYPMDRGDPRWKLTPKEVEQILSKPEAESTLEIQRQLFSNGWISAEGWFPSRSRGWYQGVSILKVDKEKGIKGPLRALNLGISVELLPISTSAGDRPTIHGSSSSSVPYIWTVVLTEVVVGDPEADLEAFKKQEKHSEWMSAIGEGCFGGCDGNTIDERSERQRRAASHTKVLGAEDLP
ncbi:MAG: hypothetical protein Q9226_009128 [Calogaya cf. arnoldii]